MLVNSGAVLRPARAGGASARSSSGWPSAACGEAARSATGCATGCSRASATGAARSRSSTASAAATCRCPTTQLPVLLPEVEDYLPKGRSPLAAAEDWVRDDVPVAAAARRGARPTRWTRSSTRPGTSSATRDPHNDAGAVRPRDRRLLAAGQPVHRRDRARDPAPALRALLHEGDERPRAGRLPRAVRAALHPGDDLLPRREDVEVEGQRRRARRLRRALRRRRGAAVHSSSSGPADQDTEWQDAGRRGHRRASCTGSGASCSRRPSKPRGRGQPDGAAGAQGARDDREGDGRHRPALRVQHADRGGDGARQRDLAQPGRSRPRGSRPRRRCR